MVSIPTADAEIVSFTSLSTDGQLYETVSGGSGCTATSNLVYMRVGYEKALAPVYKQYTSLAEFNTSSLPDNAIIESANLTLTATRYTTAGGASVTYIVAYSQKNGTYDSLDCADDNLATSIGTLTWSGTGAKVKSANISIINVSGHTYFEMDQAWSNQLSNGQSAYIDIATSEATTVVNRPNLTISYTLPSPPEPEGYCGTDYSGTGDWYVNANINCTTSNYNYGHINNIIINGSYIMDLINTSLNMSLSTSYIKRVSYNSIFKWRWY